MMKQSRLFATSICLLCILGLVALPVSAGLKDVLQSDEFEGSKLSDIWSIDNPDVGKFQVSGGKLNVTGGFNGNVWGDSDALFFYQEVSQKNFDITTDFVHTYDGECSTVAGLLVKSETTKDDNDRDGEWVTLKLWGRAADNGSDAVLQYQRRESDAGEGYVGVFKDTDGVEYKPKAGDITISMRIKRDGDTYESWFKPEGKGDWISVGKVEKVLNDPVKVGIFAGIADTKGVMTNVFDNFIEASSSVTAVDPKNRLTTTWGMLKTK